MPPVAFDRRCYRIGYGAGFYDRTIPILRHMHPVFTLGFAFACQEVEAVPDEQHDVPLDAIATEAELIVPGAAADAHPVPRRHRRAHRAQRGDRDAAGPARGLAPRCRGHQRGERRRRLRPDGGDLRGDRRGGRGRHHARQSRLRPARGARLHRARAAPRASGQLPAGHAGPRRHPGRPRERRPPPRHAGDGARLHGRARRSLRWRSSASSRPARSAGRPMPSSSTSMRRRPARSRRSGHVADGRASLVVGTHTHVPTADHRILVARHRLCLRRRHVRRLRQRARHGQGRADPPLHPQGARRPIRAGDGHRDACRGIAVETDDATGLAARIAPVRLGGRHLRGAPDFWE